MNGNGVALQLEKHENVCAKVSYEEAFEQTGQGKFNRFVLLTSGLCLLSVIVESFGVSYAMPAAACDLKLENSQKGLLSSSTLIGILSSSFVWGYLSDTRGRKGVMLPCLFLSAIFSCLSAFSVNYIMFLVMRILTGVCLSASAATVYAYLGELHTKERRASAIAYACIFMSLALILLPALAWLVLTTKWTLMIPILNMNFSTWRAFMITCTSPSILAGICLSILPESPRYFYAMGETEKATEILYKIYRWNFSKDEARFLTIKLSPDESLANASVPPSMLRSIYDQTVPLFQMPLIVCSLMSFVFQFSIFSVSSGFYLWVPEILNKMLMDGFQTKESVCQILEKRSIGMGNTTASEDTAECNPIVDSSVFPISLAMGFIFAMSYVLIGAIINKVGKRLILGLILSTCGMATVATPLVKEPIAAMVLLVTMLSSGCAGSVATSVAVDLFPTHLRAMAMCLSLMVGRTGAVVGSTLIGAMIDTHCSTAFYILGGFMLFCSLITFLWPKEEDVKKKLRENGLKYT